ncbi:unnamed protein product [Amaranthus hypochondriacus]
MGCEIQIAELLQESMGFHEWNQTFSCVVQGLDMRLPCFSSKDGSRWGWYAGPLRHDPPRFKTRHNTI